MLGQLDTNFGRSIPWPGSERTDASGSGVVGQLWPVMVTLVTLALAVLVTVFVGLAPIPG